MSTVTGVGGEERHESFPVRLVLPDESLIAPMDRL